MTTVLPLLLFPILTSTTCIDGDDLACSLGGKCINETCHCDPTWKGKFCDELDLLPSNTYKAFYRSYQSSWGGSVVYTNNDNHYHMFAEDMAYNCTLPTWQTNCDVVHAVSTKPDGPYNFQSIAVPIFACNPTVHETADKYGYFMYHIGSGDNKNGWENCSNSTVKYMDTINDYQGIPNQAFTTDINGKWSNKISSGGNYAYNNPAAYTFDNGTVLLVYKYGNATFKAFALATAPSWNATFTNIKHLPNLQGEDAYIYRDPNGYFHIIYHTYPHKQGATAYSEDGLNWYFANRTAAFPYYYTLINGTHINLAQRERHQLVFKDKGWPSYLFNGVEEEGVTNGFTYTGVQPINNTV